MRRGPGSWEKAPLTRWYVLHLELGLSSGEDSMEFIACIQGQAEVSRGPHDLVPISEGIPQDVLENFRVQESRESLEDVNLSPLLAQSTHLYSGEMRGIFQGWTGPPGRGACQAAWFRAWSLDLRYTVRKSDLSHLCFSLNFYFLMFL